MAKKSTKLVIITDAAELSAFGAKIIKAINNTDAFIQRYLCSEIAHIELYRNPTRLNQFFEGLKKTGARSHAMHQFIQCYANVTWKDADAKKDTKAGYVVNEKRAPEIAAKMLATAIATKWTDKKPEGKVRQFNLDDSLETLLTSAFKAGYTTEEIIQHVGLVETKAKEAAATALAKAAKEAAKEAATVKPEAVLIKGKAKAGAPMPADH